VLVTQVIECYHDPRDECVAFGVLPAGCIDGLDTCFADEAVNQEIRLLILRALYAIYRFYTGSAMELDEEIPGPLVGNTTLELRQVIAGRMREALFESKDGSRSPVFKGIRRFC
jgi:hypothetical protein